MATESGTTVNEGGVQYSLISSSYVEHDLAVQYHAAALVPMVSHWRRTILLISFTFITQFVIGLTNGENTHSIPPINETRPLSPSTLNTTHKMIDHDANTELVWETHSHSAGSQISTVTIILLTCLHAVATVGIIRSTKIRPVPGRKTQDSKLIMTEDGTLRPENELTVIIRKRAIKLDLSQNRYLRIGIILAPIIAVAFTLASICVNEFSVSGVSAETRYLLRDTARPSDRITAGAFGLSGLNTIGGIKGGETYACTWFTDSHDIRTCGTLGAAAAFVFIYSLISLIMSIMIFLYITYQLLRTRSVVSGRGVRPLPTFHPRLFTLILLNSINLSFASFVWIVSGQFALDADLFVPKAEFELGASGPLLVGPKIMLVLMKGSGGHVTRLEKGKSPNLWTEANRPTIANVYFSLSLSSFFWHVIEYSYVPTLAEVDCACDSTMIGDQSPHAPSMNSILTIPTSNTEPSSGESHASEDNPFEMTIEKAETPIVVWH